MTLVDRSDKETENTRQKPVHIDFFQKMTLVDRSDVEKKIQDKSPFIVDTR